MSHNRHSSSNGGLLRLISHWIVASFLLAYAAIPAAAAEGLDGSVKKIAEELGQQLAKRDSKKLAIGGFSELNGYNSALGEYISEDLTTALFSVGDFDVVERRELERVLSEHAQYATGIFDPENVAEFGKILSIDALVTGSITRLGDRVKINARAIDIETGRVFAASSAIVDADPTVQQLLSQTGSSRSSAPRAPGVVVQPSDISCHNNSISVVPISVRVSEDRKSFTVTTEMRNHGEIAIFTGKKYTAGGTTTATTNMGDSFRNLSVSGIDYFLLGKGPISENSRISKIDPGQALTLVWSGKSAGSSIMGDRLVLRNTFVIAGSRTSDFQCQLDGIQLN